MPESAETIDYRIDMILESITNHEKVNFKELARDNDVPYQRLLARSKGRQSRSNRPSATYKLSSAQDNALYDYIVRLDELGVCVRLPMIVSCANYLLQQGHEGSLPAPSANTRWAKNGLNAILSFTYDVKKHLSLIVRLHTRLAREWITSTKCTAHSRQYTKRYRKA
jgi:hypothetical protein